jgi:hypothetical protein
MQVLLGQHNAGAGLLQGLNQFAYFLHHDINIFCYIYIFITYYLYVFIICYIYVFMLVHYAISLFFMFSS